MSDGPNAPREFQPEDPRRKAREAVGAGRLAEANAWATLAAADATHRLAKILGRVFDQPDSIADVHKLERGRHRRPSDQPDSTEQAA